jgi:hypothetical protein
MLQGLAQGVPVLQTDTGFSFQQSLMLFKSVPINTQRLSQHGQLSRPGAVKMSVPPNSFANAANTAIILLNSAALTSFSVCCS